MRELATLLVRHGLARPVSARSRTGVSVYGEKDFLRGAQSVRSAKSSRSAVIAAGRGTDPGHARASERCEYLQRCDEIPASALSSSLGVQSA